MKKIILLLLSAVLAITAAKSQEYHPHDVSKLKAFLKQPSAEVGKSNGEQIGLTKAEVATIDADNDWVGKVSLTWTQDIPKRILNVTMWGGRHLSGTLDLSGCTALNALYCWGNQLIHLNLDDCTDLDDLQPADNQLTSLDLKHNTRLRVLFCGQNLLADLDLTNNTDLQHLDCNGNQLTTLDLTNNTKLYALRCVGIPLLDMYVHFTTPLPHIRYNNATGDNSLVVVLNDVGHATLHVPVGTKQLYQNADEWKRFGTIVESGSVSTAFLPSSPLVSVFSVGITLSVLTPSSESLTLYSPSGSLLFRSSKLPGHATFTIGHLPKGVIIVKGSTGWVRKIFR
jgi:hypothetical protein